MSRKVKVTISAFVSLILAGAAGTYAAYRLAPPDGCWTDGCRAEQAKQLAAASEAAQTRAQAAWADVGKLVQQQIDIAQQTATAGREGLAAADARTQGQLDRIAYLTDGLNSGGLLSVGRPYLNEAESLARQRDERGTAFGGSVGRISRAIANVQLAVRGDLPPPGPQQLHMKASSC